MPKETLIKRIPFMVRSFDKLTTHHERNQHLTVRPEPVEGLNQRFPNITVKIAPFGRWTQRGKALRSAP